MESNLHCSICNKIYKTPAALSQHLRRIHNQKERLSILCFQNDCDQRFSQVRFYKDHLINQHALEIDEETITFETLADFDEWNFKPTLFIVMSKHGVISSFSIAIDLAFSN
jgi:hypothetical protein